MIYLMTNTQSFLSICKHDTLFLDSLSKSIKNLYLICGKGIAASLLIHQLEIKMPSIKVLFLFSLVPFICSQKDEYDIDGHNAVSGEIPSQVILLLQPPKHYYLDTNMFSRFIFLGAQMHKIQIQTKSYAKHFVGAPSTTRKHVVALLWIVITMMIRLITRSWQVY